ncbi:MAG: hypothetical protein DPW09_11040 [Anaerolineae bacterium]|nr:hypothetical protein [Anaerolineae bacterium]
MCLFVSKSYHISVRLPLSIAEVLKRQAVSEHRSVNGMIVHLLSQVLETEAQSPAPAATQSPGSASGDWPGPAAQSAPSTKRVI